MSRLDRFGRVEGRRSDHAPAPDASRPSAIEGRFDFDPPPGAAEAEAPPGGTAPDGAPPPRSGGQPARFESGEAETALRVLEVGDGLSFVRCALCRADSHAAAVRCGQCGADLFTREQRAFNEVLWRHRREERAEEDREAERLRARREEADREMAEAFRRKAAIEADLARRQALGLPLDLADDVRNPLEAGARALGHLIGRWLRRAFPSRAGRLLFLGAAAALLVLVLAVSTVARWAFGIAAFLVFILAAANGEIGTDRR